MLACASTTRLLLLLLAASAPAQVAGTSAVSKPTPRHAPRSAPGAATQARTDDSVIYLDPAHGGTDAGALLAPGVAEKDATLALAIKLRLLLGEKGFRVMLARDNDADVSSDQRIDLAERAHASACLLLHATSSGHGVHLYASSLSSEIQATHTRADSDRIILPWDTAQAPALDRSVALESDLASALSGTRIPLVTGRASVAPIDSITCPAVAIEVAPYTADGAASVNAANSGYQQRIAETIAAALAFRREHPQAAPERSHLLPAAHPQPHSHAVQPAPAPAAGAARKLLRRLRSGAQKAPGAQP